MSIAVNTGRKPYFVALAGGSHSGTVPVVYAATGESSRAIIPLRLHTFEAACDLSTGESRDQSTSLDTRSSHVRPFKMGHNQA